MGKIAVFASGSGSNFQVIAEAIAATDHSIDCLICDRKNARAIERAMQLDIPVKYISYYKRSKEDAEQEILHYLANRNISLIVLAGYMRLLTPLLIDAYKNKIINIHPSLLPKYPGTTAIETSFNSGDLKLGITIHRVDYGMDTGPVILQKSFTRTQDESLEEVETKIHQLEHKHYPQVILNLLNNEDFS